MIQLKLAVCAESVVQDTATNTVSVFNILEDINASAFPVAIPKLSSLFVLEREKGDPDQVDCVVILTLGEVELGRASINGDFEGKLRVRLILVAQGMVIPDSGILSANLIVNGERMGFWQMLVHEVDPTSDR